MREYLSDQPMSCHIRVCGGVEPEWLSDLLGLSVAKEAILGNTLVLSGVTADQAALVGLINTLYSFGLTIIDFHCFPARKAQNPH